ncbi:hypothetical protein [Flectobacillus roseus]|uniref:Outer membrane protein beta-barrel domain-containing protein n=1 Tax=Flectobacillus roseus TaxID=502259 RepID=A0ABT6YFJ5_9BACT|nr:hypothetical protein [Flectobacillus roseus]MDI9862197.1 hypothetical protein [Flectobacillus roseus]
MNRFFLILLLFLSKVVVVSGQQFYQNLGLGISASTMGIGPELSYYPAKYRHWGVRAHWVQFSYKDPIHIGMANEKSLDIKPTIQKQVGAIYLDYFPFKKQRWHVFGGLSYNLKQDYLFNVTTKTGVSLGGIDIQATDFGSINLGIKWSEWMPALGLGYLGNIYKNRLLLGVDFGLSYMGSPKLQVSYEGFLETTTLDEQIPKLERNIRNYSYYPNLNFQLKYLLGKK